MKLDCLKEKKELVPVLLLGVSAFFAVFILVKLTFFLAASAKAEGLVKRAVEQNKTDAKDMEKYLAESKTLADELKKNNLFAPPPPKQHPVKEVLGIFGDEVLIKDKWYKVGDMVGDAKIVEVEPTEVKIEWNGREQMFAPISSSGSEGPRKPQSDSPRMGRTTRRKEFRAGGAVTVIVGNEIRGNGSSEVSGNLSEKERAKLQLKEEKKQRLITEKEKPKKPLKNNSEKIQAKQKIYKSQTKKRSDDSKPKKEGTQGKIKKQAAK